MISFSLFNCKGSKSSNVAPAIGCADTSNKLNSDNLLVISYAYIGTASGLPSSFNLRFNIFPEDVETTALLIGIAIFITLCWFSITISALTETDGIVLLAIKATKPIASIWLLCNPVTIPLSSTPKYKMPPLVFAIAETASIISLSG